MDLKKIASKQATDVLLQPNDIVEVRESTGKSMIRSLLGVVAPAMGQLPMKPMTIIRFFFMRPRTLKRKKTFNAQRPTPSSLRG